MKRNGLSNREIERLTKEKRKGTKICKCGHRVCMAARTDKKICSWCGRYVFKNDEIEFKYRLLQTLKKGKIKNEYL